MFTKLLLGHRALPDQMFAFIENITFQLPKNNNGNLLDTMKKTITDNKSILGACTMVYGEYINNWLLQWIEYNIHVVGVSTFYIYDDAGNRPSNTKKIITEND